MPVIFSQVNNDWHKHWERLLLISLQDIKEIVVFEEAHSSVSDLQMDSADTLDNSFEELWNQVLDFVDFTDFEDFLQFSQEQGLLDTVCEGPELE